MSAQGLQDCQGKLRARENNGPDRTEFAMGIYTLRSERNSVRILVMSGIYPPYFIGGGEISCQRQAEELEKRGHQVFVLTSCWGIGQPAVMGNVYRRLRYDPNSLTPPHANVRWDPLRLRRRLDQISRALALSKNYEIARSVVAAVQPDVAYVWQMECTSVSPMLATQDLGIPNVIRTPDYMLAQMKVEIFQERNPLKRWYREKIVILGDMHRLDTRYIIATSQATMQCYVAAGFSMQHMQVIPQGVRSELLITAEQLSNSVGQCGGETRLLFAGRLVREKGPDVAIQALSNLVQDPITCQARLDIIGPSSEEYAAELKALVQSLHLESRVSFFGQLGRTELFARYDQYHALLFTSRWLEPFGMTVLEAMARGVPVIATNLGGPAEIIADGVNGLLVPPGDPVALANAIKRLVQEPGLARKIRCAALETVRAKYTNERIVDQVERYLEQVVDGSSKSS